jgi:tetratricopeptide (TPR) repeat protein
MRSRLTSMLVCLGLFALTAAAFAGVLGNDFVNYDDHLYVTQNPQVQGGLSWDGVRWAFTTMHAANWHPLCWLSLQLDAQFYGLRPWGFHLTSLLLHGANAVLLFLTLRRMTGAIGRSAFVAAFFAVHPLHVESVAWVAERKDVLNTFFGLLALLAYAWYVERPRPGRYHLVVACFALSLLAKPMLVTLPCLLLVLDFWPLGRFPTGATQGAGATLDAAGQGADLPGGASPRATSWRWLLLEKAPLLALTVVSSAVTVVAQRAGGAVADARLPLLPRLVNAVLAYGAYLRKAVWPSDLAVFYPYYPGRWEGWHFAAAVLVLGLLTVLAIALRRRLPALLVGWLWYLGTLVPVIGLVQVGEQALADRYTYFPLIGIFLAVVWSVPVALSWVFGRPGGPAVSERVLARALAVLAAAGVLLCALSTRAEVHHWRNSRALWTHAVEVIPDNYLALENLGRLLLLEGDVRGAEPLLSEAVRLRPHAASVHYSLGVCLFAARRVDEAEEKLLAVLRLDPRHAEAHGDLGLICQQKGRDDDALRHYRAALQSNPELVDAHNNLGTLLLMRGQQEEALDHFTEAIRLAPARAAGYKNLGVALGCAGKWPEAAEALREAVQLRPGDADLLGFLAQALQEAGQSEAAAAACREALRLDPTLPARFTAVAWQLATAAERRNGPVALQFARAACLGTAEQVPEPLEALAAALAEAGRFDDAAVAMRRAVELSPASQPTLLAQRQDRLRQIQRRQPLRSPTGLK